jgi:hypothetical protein
MRGPRVKPQYGPTLPALLAPRWRSASVGLRGLVVAAVAAVVVAVVAAVVVVGARTSSFVYRGSPVSFNFSYPRGLRQVKPPAGADLRLEGRTPSGRLRDWFEVDPLALPPYSGEISGQLPVFAANYIAELVRRIPGFRLQTETKTRINLTAGYSVTYSGQIEGQLMYGRLVMLVPALTGARNGVVLNMGIVPNATIDSTPDQVGSIDVLEKPLRSFRFGT